MDGESLTRRGLFVALLEIIDIFFDTHRVFGRQITIIQIITHDGIRAGIYIKGEGRKMIVIGINNGIRAIVFEKHIGWLAIALLLSKRSGGCALGLIATRVARRATLGRLPRIRFPRTIICCSWFFGNGLFRSRRLFIFFNTRGRCWRFFSWFGGCTECATTSTQNESSKQHAI